jgi:iron complex outermembrane receptor protein
MAQKNRSLVLFRLAAAAGLIALAPRNLSAQTSPALADSGQVQQLEAYTVTGSHISSLDGATAQPVVQFTGVDIANSGYPSLGDFLQAQSFNSGGVGNLLQSSVSGVGVPFSRGATSLNMRGLGAGNSLILVNGRRAASYANPDSQGATVFDLKTLPTAAIERVEFLKDGASAIYGSDAITGVMNIILKDTYDGVEAEVSLGGATNDPATLLRKASVIAGGGNDKTSYMVNLSWSKQDGAIINEYKRSPDSDYSDQGIKGKNSNSTQNHPANVNLTAGQAAGAGLTTGKGYYSITGGIPTANPTLGNFSFFGAASNIPESNKNDLTGKSLVPASEQWNLFTLLNHKFNESVSGFFQYIASNIQTNYVYSAVGARDSTVEVSGSFLTAIPSNTQGGTKNPKLIIPAGNPFNPFNANITSFTFLPAPELSRTWDVESEASTLLAGLKGKLSNDWAWGTSASYAHNLFTQIQGNSLRADDLQNALNGTFSGLSGVYLNPFGSSDKALLDALYFDSLNVYTSTGYAADFNAAGPIAKMPELFGNDSPGDISMAVGLEWHKDSLLANPDSSNLIGTNNGFPFDGNRSVTSEFVELKIPFIPKLLEVQMAARHEGYSDFGDTTKMKLAFGSQLTSFLKLRGSYSESFKAPDLAQLFGGGLTATAAILDPENPSAPSQKYKKIIGANSNLKPQQGEVYYAGVVVDLGELVSNLSFSIDYIDIKISDAIVPISTFTEAQVFSYFPELVVRDPVSNGISYFDMTPFNGVAYYYQGLDFAVDYLLNTQSFGSFKFNVQATHVMYLASDPGTGEGIQDFTGRYGFGGQVQEWTGNASVGWITRKFNSSLSVLYKGSVLNDSAGSVAAGKAWEINPIALFNATVTYKGPWNTDFTLSCNNLLNTQPPVDGIMRPYANFDIASYGAWASGRFVTLKLSKKF